MGLYIYKIEKEFRVNAVVEDVGFEPLLIAPNDACYRYTTSSIFSTQAGVIVEPKCR